MFEGFTDCHCHILPGVDDGVETMEEALAILALYEQTGIREVWLTPHIMEDVPNTTAALRQRFGDLSEAYKGPIALHLSAENMLDSVFAERLEHDDVLPWGPRGDRLLVETSYVHAPVHFHDLLQRIMAKGFFPMLAHPERYVYMSPDDYRALKDRGVEFQLNIFSLFGFYGQLARKKAEHLLAAGYYDYAATDLHAYDVMELALRERLGTKTIRRVKQIANSK